MNARHCLVVDDDEDFRTVLAGVLVRRGYRVSTAANLAAGQELASLDAPDKEIDQLWMEEVEHRIDAYERGEMKALRIA